MPEILTWELLGVGPDEVATVGLLHYENDDPLEFLISAHAYLEDGTEVHGVPFTWQVNGQAILETDDKNPAIAGLKFEKPGETALITAEALGQTASLELSGTP